MNWRQKCITSRYGGNTSGIYLKKSRDIMHSIRKTLMALIAISFTTWILIGACMYMIFLWWYRIVRRRRQRTYIAKFAGCLLWTAYIAKKKKATSARFIAWHVRILKHIQDAGTAHTKKTTKRLTNRQVSFRLIYVLYKSKRLGLLGASSRRYI